MRLNHRRWVLLSLFVVLVVLCGGCDEFSNRNISQKLTLSSPIRLNQPVTATIVADFREDTPAVGISLSGRGPNWNGARAIQSWNVGDVSKGQHVEVSTVITFTQPGYYNLVAGLGTKLGSFNSTGLYLFVNESGAVFNPTPVYGPGTPAPAQPASPLSPVEPTRTPPR
jgi:hypothetical protein